MTRGHLLEEGLTREVIGAFFEVYDELGFGFAAALRSRTEILSTNTHGGHEANAKQDSALTRSCS